MNKKYSDKTKEKVIEQYLAGVSVSDLETNSKFQEQPFTLGRGSTRKVKSPWRLI